jgi:hypothetical protein
MDWERKKKVKIKATKIIALPCKVDNDIMSP